MKKSDEDKMEEVKKFVRDAFVIDGDVDWIRAPITFDTHFRCTDSKRGTIFIAFNGEGKDDSV